MRINYQLVFAFIGLAVLLSPASETRAGQPLSAATILEEIKAKGPESVFKGLWKDDDKWSDVINNIESGETQWLKVAVELHKAADGGASEMLFLAAGVALVRAPHEVLVIGVPELGIEGVCGFPDMADPRFETKKNTITYLDDRIKAVSRLTQSDVAVLRTRCLEILNNTKREVLSPKGPFSGKFGF